MARVKIDSIIEQLGPEFRRALEAAVEEVQPNNHIDSHDLFRGVKRSVSRKCGTWVRVSDSYVEKD